MVNGFFDAKGIGSASEARTACKGGSEAKAGALESPTAERIGAGLPKLIFKSLRKRMHRCDCRNCFHHEAFVSSTYQLLAGRKNFRSGQNCILPLL